MLLKITICTYRILKITFLKMNTIESPDENPHVWLKQHYITDIESHGQIST